MPMLRVGTMPENLGLRSGHTSRYTHGILVNEERRYFDMFLRDTYHSAG